VLALRTGGAEDATDLVVRLRHDVLSRGFLGGIVTAQDAPGSAGLRRTAGLDFELPTLLREQNLVFAAFAMASWDSAGAPGRRAWRVFVDYPNDWSDNFISVSRVDPGFDPALGFVREDGILRYQSAWRFFPRPRRWGIRRLTLMPIFLDVANHTTGGLAHASYEIIPLGIETDAGDEVEIALERSVDVPDEDFEIFPGDTIRAGRYEYDRVAFGFDMSSGRPFSADVEVSFGEFYSGRATAVGVELELRAAPHVIAGVEVGQQHIRHAGGRFTAREARLRLDYAATPRLASTLFLQWDNESERVTINARLHWIPRPGSDAYLVWNSAWPTGLARGVPWGRPLRGALVAKLVWYLRG
jgi:hypothetical protein